MGLSELLTLSVKLKASDLHLAPGLVPRLRIDGDLRPIENEAPLTPEALKALIYGEMSQEQQQEFEKNFEIDFATVVPSVARFRVNVFYQADGIAAVFRTIPEAIPTLDELQLPPVFKELLNLPNGLILVTGPTGSGKSTTLAAMVDYINQEQSSHIITIEDPIEFKHTSKKCLVNQRQVHRDTHDFSNALRSALREDPDVILLGEMRDLETIRLALTAAETGHLVMATLHTSSAPRTINRIVDVFPAGEKEMIRNMLSESLQAVICQTLVKKVGGGRAAALEIMLGTPAIRNLIREDKVSQMMTAIQTGADVGMCTLDQYLQNLVTAGVIDLPTAHAAAVSKTLFNQPAGSF
ncbi:MAG: type IV pilus twitching motility protein PilT [Gammaproteobacteria bacterium]